MEYTLGSCSFCLLQRKPHLCMAQAFDSVRYICRSAVAESCWSLKTLSDVSWRSCSFSIPTSSVWELQLLIHTLSRVKVFSFICFPDCDLICIPWWSWVPFNASGPWIFLGEASVQASVPGFSRFLEFRELCKHSEYKPLSDSTPTTTLTSLGDLGVALGSVWLGFVVVLGYSRSDFPYDFNN